MVKSGLIFGVVMLVVALGVTLVMPYCIPCVALGIGFAAGYVAGVFGKPADKSSATKSGTMAGALAGAGVVLGEMAGAVINGYSVGPEKTAELMQTLGIPGVAPMTASSYWTAMLGMNLCMSLFSVALMAGLGALGGLVWWQARGKNQSAPPSSFPSSPAF
jgi:hypothetical protein